MRTYDNPYWEYHLPVNPPGAYFDKEFDVMMTESDIANWFGDGGPEFQPRLRDAVQNVDRTPRATDEAPELDLEYDDEGYDCD